MKIAVLISGEYRTFPVCRKTMTFLDDPNVDVYVSTWDKSIIRNTRLKIHKEDDITADQIRNDLGRSATILVEKSDCCVIRNDQNRPLLHCREKRHLCSW